MSKFINKKWIVSTEFGEVKGFFMKPGFLYSIDKETGELIEVVTSVSDNMEDVTLFKKDGGVFKHNFYYIGNLDKHVADSISENLSEMEDRKIFYPYPAKEKWKKIAMDFIKYHKCPYGTYEEEFQAYNDGTPSVIKKFASFPQPIADFIRSHASNNGWDGCHWDDPLLLEVDSSEKDEYEESFRPPHLW